MEQHLAKPEQTKLIKTQHWTENNPLRLVRSISSDFVAQLETRMEEFDGFTHAELAKRLSVTLGRVSQMMNSPGNFTLKNGVVYANACDMDIAVVAYPKESVNTNAPISGDVFRACWEIAGCPTNMFEIAHNTVGYANNSGGIAAIGHTWGSVPINLGGGTSLDANYTAQTDYNQKLISGVCINAQSI
jgi:hypothetical protein